MTFVRDNQKLTITKKDLNKKERGIFKTLVRLDDEQNLALWTIEHQERKKPNNYDSYYKAYCLWLNRQGWRIKNPQLSGKEGRTRPQWK